MVFLFPAFIICAILIFFHLREKNKQRELLIAKGVYPDGISLQSFQKMRNLTNGILFISLGIGLLLAYLITENTRLNNFMIVYFISIFLSCGFGFVANYFLYRNMKDE